MKPLRRRRALELVAAGGLTSLAGCFSGHPDCRPRLGIRLRGTTGADIADDTDRTPGELHPLAADLVRSAAASGTATYHSADTVPSGLSREPIRLSMPGSPQHRYVRLDDGYYRILIDAVAEGSTTEHVLVGRTNPTVNADGQSGDSIEHDALPTHDRRAFLSFLGSYVGDDEGDPPRFGALWYVGYLRDEHVQSSSLVPRPEHDYIGYRGWFLHVEKTDTSEGTRVTYEVTLEHVADTASGFAGAVTKTDGVVLREEDHSPDQHEMLEEAIEGTYWECADYSDGFAELAATLEDARYASYDGTWYDVTVTRGV